MSDSIKVSIELADAAAKKVLGDFVARADDVDKKFKKMGDTGNSAFNQLTVSIGKSLGVFDIFAGNLAANLVTKGFEVMAQSAGKLFDTLVVDGIAAAQESEVALNDLNQALARSGIYSAETSEEFQNFASELQKTTTFEDDLIIKNMALIQNLAQLDKEGLQTATKSSLNLSAALGIDLQTASTAVAKAANGNYVALNKMGIEFDKTGSKSQTFANALQSIEERFGGAATAKVNTFAGSIEQAKNFFGDLQEEIGGLIISNPAVVAAISSLTDSLIATVEGFKSGSGSARALGEGLLAIIRTVEITTRVFDGLLTAILTVWDLAVIATATAFQNILRPLTLFSDTAETIFQGLGEQVEETSQKMSDRLGNGGVLTGAIDTLDSMGDSAEAALSKMGTSADEVAPKIRNVAGGIKELSEAEEKQREAANKFTEQLANKNLSIEENQKLELERLKIFNEEKALVEQEGETINYQAKLQRLNDFFVQSQASTDAAFALEQEKVLASSLSAEMKTNALLAAEKRYEVESLKNQSEYNKKRAATNDELSKKEIQDRKDTFSTIATLSTSSNQTLASIGKAAGLVQLAIDTEVAVGKALAAFPPPFNFAAAGLVGAAMAARAANLAGLSFEDGGIVPGTSFTGDRVQANVNSGEMILNRPQQAKLFAIANGKPSSSGGSGMEARLAEQDRRIEMILSQPIVVQVDGRELINITRNQLASGRTI